MTDLGSRITEMERLLRECRTYLKADKYAEYPHLIARIDAAINASQPSATATVRGEPSQEDLRRGGVVGLAPTLEQLLQEAATREMTPLDAYEQKVSWVYGQLKSGSGVTRKDIEAQLMRMGYAKPNAAPQERERRSGVEANSKELSAENRSRSGNNATTNQGENPHPAVAAPNTAPDAPTPDLDTLIQTIRYICVKAGVAETTMGEICHQVRHSGIDAEHNRLQSLIEGASMELPPIPARDSGHGQYEHGQFIFFDAYIEFREVATLAIAKERALREEAEASIAIFEEELKQYKQDNGIFGAGA